MLSDFVSNKVSGSYLSGDFSGQKKMVKLQLKIYQTKKKSHLKIHYPPSFPHEYNKLKAQQASAEI